MRHDPFTRFALLCGFLAGILPLVSFSDAQAQTSDLDVTDRVVVASAVYSLVQQYFAHWEGAPRSEVDGAYREYIAHVVRDSSRKDFDLATLRFIARLRNGHTQFFDNSLDGRPLKFRLLEVEDKWVVINSQDSRLWQRRVTESPERNSFRMQGSFQTRILSGWRTATS